MAAKLKVSLFWVWVLILPLILLGVIFLIQLLMVRQISMQAVSSAGAVSPPLNLQAARPKEELPFSALVGAVSPAAKGPLPARLQKKPQQIVESPDGNIPINAPMSDEQILEQIKQQDQARQRKQQIVAERNRRADEVRQAARFQNQPADNKQVIFSDSPAPAAPASIAEKVKSNRLTIR